MFVKHLWQAPAAKAYASSAILFAVMYPLQVAGLAWNPKYPKFCSASYTRPSEIVLDAYVQAIKLGFCTAYTHIPTAMGRGMFGEGTSSWGRCAEKPISDASICTVEPHNDVFSKVAFQIGKRISLFPFWNEIAYFPD